jgi:hypothetical protein
LIADSFIAPAKDQPRRNEGREVFQPPSITDRIGCALRIFGAARSNLDAYAARLFRKLHGRRVSTLRKPGAMSYRNGASPPSRQNIQFKTGGKCMLMKDLFSFLELVRRIK